MHTNNLSILSVFLLSILTTSSAKKYNIRVDFEINVNAPDPNNTPSGQNITTVTTTQSSNSVVVHNDTTVNLEINIVSAISQGTNTTTSSGSENVDGETAPTEDENESPTYEFEISVGGSGEGDFEATLETETADIGEDDDEDSTYVEGIIPKEGLSVPIPSCKNVLLCLPKFIRGVGSKEVCRTILTCDNNGGS